MSEATGLSPGPRPRVLLADDHAEILSALRRMLQPFCEVIGMVCDGRALLEEIASRQPDVVVVDLNMPGLSGLEACRLIRQAAPGTRVVMLTASDDPAIRRKAQELGASAFVLKYQVADHLVPAILGALT
jgi:DNA-binding NarL/FixJ family response regulator